MKYKSVLLFLLFCLLFLASGCDNTSGIDESTVSSSEAPDGTVIQAQTTEETEASSDIVTTEETGADSVTVTTDFSRDSASETDRETEPETHERFDVFEFVGTIDGVMRQPRQL